MGPKKNKTSTNASEPKCSISQLYAELINFKNDVGFLENALTSQEKGKTNQIDATDEFQKNLENIHTSLEPIKERVYNCIQQNRHDENVGSIIQTIFLLFKYIEFLINKLLSVKKKTRTTEVKTRLIKGTLNNYFNPITERYLFKKNSDDSDGTEGENPENIDENNKAISEGTQSVDNFKKIIDEKIEKLADIIKPNDNILNRTEYGKHILERISTRKKSEEYKKKITKASEPDIDISDIIDDEGNLDELPRVATEVLKSMLNGTNNGENVEGDDEKDGERVNDELPRVATEILKSMLNDLANKVEKEGTDVGVGDEFKDGDELSKVATEILKSMLNGDNANSGESVGATNRVNDNDELSKVATQVLGSMLNGDENNTEDHGDELLRLATDVLQSILNGIVNEVNPATPGSTAAATSSSAPGSASRPTPGSASSPTPGSASSPTPGSASSPTPATTPTSSSDDTDDNDKIMKKCGNYRSDDYFLVGITKTGNASNSKESCIYFNKTKKDVQVTSPP
jgi:hypothetical protein